MSATGKEYHYSSETKKCRTVGLQVGLPSIPAVERTTRSSTSASTAPRSPPKISNKFPKTYVVNLLRTAKSTKYTKKKSGVCVVCEIGYDTEEDKTFTNQMVKESRCGLDVTKEIVNIGVTLVAWGWF